MNLLAHQSLHFFHHVQLHIDGLQNVLHVVGRLGVVGLLQVRQTRAKHLVSLLDQAVVLILFLLRETSDFVGLFDVLVGHAHVEHTDVVSGIVVVRIDCEGVLVELAGLFDVIEVLVVLVAVDGTKSEEQLGIVGIKFAQLVDPYDLSRGRITYRFK